MMAVNQKIEELASTMHEALLESGDQEVSYAQIEDSIRNHLGVRFMRDVMPEATDEKPVIDDLVHLESTNKHHHGHKKSHKHHK